MAGLRHHSRSLGRLSQTVGEGRPAPTNAVEDFVIGLGKMARPWLRRSSEHASPSQSRFETTCPKGRVWQRSASPISPTWDHTSRSLTTAAGQACPARRTTSIARRGHSRGLIGSERGTTDPPPPRTPVRRWRWITRASSTCRLGPSSRRGRRCTTTHATQFGSSMWVTRKLGSA